MNKSLATYAALIFTVLAWGLSFIGTKIALSSFSPFICIFLRFSLASLLFSLLLFRHGFFLLPWTEHKKLMLLALLQPGLYFTFETFGLTFTTASKASIILAMVPIAVMVFARIFLQEKIPFRAIMGICISVLGILVLVVGGAGFKGFTGGSLTGDILILGAVLAAALYMVLARSLGKTISPLQITGFQFIYGTVIFAPLFLINLPGMDWNSVSHASVVALIFLVIFATVGGFLCYNYALSRIEASKASVFINGMPVITALAGWAILDEVLSLLQIAGGLLVLIGVFITSSQRLRQKPSL